MHAYTLSLEAKLKEHVPTSYSTCELHASKNLELAHYVDLLQDGNDEFRKMMGWLSGHEPQLKMMIEAYKHYDGQALDSEKVGECSVEGGEKIGYIQAPLKTFHKNCYAPKANPLKTNLTQPQILPYPLTAQMISKNPSSLGVACGMSSLVKRVRSRVRKNQVSSPNPSQN
jgi:hypothetical protein